MITTAFDVRVLSNCVFRMVFEIYYQLNIGQYCIHFVMIHVGFPYISVQLVYNYNYKTIMHMQNSYEGIEFLLLKEVYITLDSK